ncbi:hypothetical protein [Bradyrhizobium sp. ARR65]|uniref:hypothetical protein n=1 Tax=Bradyrhizobium sp. ARR65 TaxID=1040989 RepID=UPI0018DE98F2|nr:hypothetical protein [Bradyrhizobium sp. ARR65]
MFSPDPAMKPDSKSKRKGRRKVVKNLLAAAAVAATVYAFVPVHAAKVGVGCTGENLARAEGAVETMADSPSKSIAEREVAAAQDAMLTGRMSGCALHLARAMHAGAMAQAPRPGMPGQPSYTNTIAQPSAETMPQAPSQPQWGWKPLQSAQ